LRNGGFGTAIGRYDPDDAVLVADRLTSGRFTGAAGRLGRLSIEGYLEPVNAAPGYRISGLGHSFAQNVSLERFADARALFRGGYDGRFRPDAALVLPDAPGRRRALLNRIIERG
jgi:hypothetical protein